MEEYGYGPLFEAGVKSEDVEETVREWSSDDWDTFDGERVMLVLKMRDGRWCYIEGGCDYTGWDCQASAEAFYASTEDELVRMKLTNEARRNLGYA